MTVSGDDGTDESVTVDYPSRFASAPPVAFDYALELRNYPAQCWGPTRPRPKTSSEARFDDVTIDAAALED